MCACALLGRRRSRDNGGERERTGGQREPTKLSDSTKQKVAAAKIASGSAVKVSQGVLQGVAAMTSKMANEIADTVSKSKYAQAASAKTGAGGPKSGRRAHGGAGLTLAAAAGSGL